MPFFKYNNKNVYYRTFGKGSPLLLIHGNSVSSRMFAPIIKYFKKDFHLIIFDLPGHGKSKKLEKLPTDFWYENAKSAAALLKFLNLKDVSVIGSSGGALVGINLLLEFPDLVSKLIADSFEGEESIAEYAENIFNERAAAMKKVFYKMFFIYNHGVFWKKVVNQDTEVIFQHHQRIKKFFHRDVSEINKPVLLTASKTDEFLKNIIQPVYKKMESKIKDSKSYFFESGNHPALLSNGPEFAQLAIHFFKNNKVSIKAGV